MKFIIIFDLKHENLKVWRKFEWLYVQGNNYHVRRGYTWRL